MPLGFTELLSAQIVAQRFSIPLIYYDRLIWADDYIFEMPMAGRFIGILYLRAQLYI